jgi:carboxypeptidase Taq
MHEKYQELLDRLAPIVDLTRTQALLGWDQRTMMPPRGGAARAEQMATLTTLIHEKFTDAAIGHLLDDLRAFEESQPYDSDEASIIRVTRHDYEKLTKVPAELASAMTRARSLGQEAWVAARAASDFAQFQPFLQRNVELKYQYIECFDDELDSAGTPYDILLDDFEPGMKTAEVQASFDALKKGLLPLIAAILAKGDVVSDDCLHGDFPAEVQKEFSHKVLERLGARWDAWRLDPTVHPFAGGSYNDIRITTRYNPEVLTYSLFGTMHEFGHGLYEHQLSPKLQRTGLGDGTSMAIHESQSRMWENLVGRSRPFWQGMYGELQATYPDQFKQVDQESFYRAINRVHPSFIRVEADEATYPLHIILRFELEQEIIGGKIALRDLPEAWNARFKEYLGLDVPNDAQGVLQDVHWSYGGMGYFPTYALGSIVACQLWEKILVEIPDLEEQIAAGEFAPLREWLRANIHDHGRKFTSNELLQRVLGTGIRVEPFLRYLQGKFGEIYAI